VHKRPPLRTAFVISFTLLQCCGVLLAVYGNFAMDCKTFFLLTHLQSLVRQHSCTLAPFAFIQRHTPTILHFIDHDIFITTSLSSQYLHINTQRPQRPPVWKWFAYLYYLLLSSVISELLLTYYSPKHRQLFSTYQYVLYLRLRHSLHYRYRIQHWICRINM